jgi:predicted nucleic acid-binding protein
MILVDTSVIVAWLDPKHSSHDACTRALEGCAAIDQLAVSILTVAELAAGGRSNESINRDLHGFLRITPDEQVAFQAGRSLAKYRPKKANSSHSLANAIIWHQAAALKVPILTLEARKPEMAREVDVLQPAP